MQFGFVIYLLLNPPGLLSLTELFVLSLINVIVSLKFLEFVSYSKILFVNMKFMYFINHIQKYEISIFYANNIDSGNKKKLNKE
ncbi:hypothetical protein NMY3_00710 [Candidatus Nitrosocosmicus oleophilus]|uniref:Uncharacterized protein n=1 Tax=Candidatus Nitrosocosmicus oleophilus TaxID=1353260 RepID=A0A654LX43_9ARCH|nr:hypothetical protein NMY3_00710 [Candidatus Nitrosocosmicus oleophilus]